MNEKSRKYYEENKEAAAEGQRRRYSQNRAATQARVKKWREENRDKVAAYNREWALRNPSRIREIRRKASRKYQEVNAERLNADRRASRREDYEFERKRAKDYYTGNRDQILARKYQRLRESSATADRKGQPWSDVEDQIACDASISAREAAYILHRSEASVYTRRYNLANRKVAA
ncbi:hypothetical protein [Rhodococcus sp. MALMAid1271]|uniref:hypothetical protein n=1 Tax=Rhodococcus sp. MALMAid1271 TaxID=3411744 RepID=UPI003BA1FB09